MAAVFALEQGIFLMFLLKNITYDQGMYILNSLVNGIHVCISVKNEI